MYTCIFVKYLWKEKEKKRRFKTLEKKVDLPFVPTLGLEVCDGDWFSGSIERIVWDVKAEHFNVKVIDITPKEGRTAELLLDIAFKQGWLARD